MFGVKTQIDAEGQANGLFTIVTGGVYLDPCGAETAGTIYRTLRHAMKNPGKHVKNIPTGVIWRVDPCFWRITGRDGVEWVSKVDAFDLPRYLASIRRTLSRCEGESPAGVYLPGQVVKGDKYQYLAAVRFLRNTPLDGSVHISKDRLFDVGAPEGWY